MTTAENQALTKGIETMLPIAKELICATNLPDAEGQFGYITMFRLLSAIKDRSQSMYVCTVLALRKLHYNETALQGALSLLGD